MQSRVKKSTINIITSASSSILTLVLNYVTRLIFVRYLNASYLGISGLFTNILSILSLADLGLTTAMMFNLYKPIAENDTEKIKSLVHFFRKVYLIIATIVFIFGLVLMPFLDLIVNLDQPLDNLYLYYFLFLIETVISYLFVYRSILLNADQKNYLLTLSEIGLSITRFVARIIILVTTRNYILYLSVGILLKLICNFIQNFIATKNYPYLKEKSQKLDKNAKKEIFNNVKASFIYKFCGTIQSNTDSILISIFVGTILVGYYSNYLLVTTGVVSCITIIFSALKSSVGNFIAEQSSPEKRKELFDALELLNFWIICFCSVAFSCLFDGFITISYSKEFLLNNIVLATIVLNFYTQNIRQNIWSFRETTDVFVHTKYVTLVTAILNIILSIILGYFFGIAGIIGATVLARFLYAFWREPTILYKHVFNKNAKDYFITYFIRLFITACLCLGCHYLVNLITIENEFVCFVAQCIVTAIVPNVILLILFCRNKNFLFLFRKLKTLFVRKTKQPALVTNNNIITKSNEQLSEYATEQSINQTNTQPKVEQNEETNNPTNDDTSNQKE